MALGRFIRFFTKPRNGEFGRDAKIAVARSRVAGEENVFVKPDGYARVDVETF